MASLPLLATRDVPVLLISKGSSVPDVRKNIRQRSQVTEVRSYVMEQGWQPGSHSRSDAHGVEIGVVEADGMSQKRD